MIERKSQYEKLGIDPHKESVKKSFKSVVDNDFPLAFCVIVRDPLNPGYVITQHMDGDGSKFIQRILHYKESGDPTIFRGAADDALSMNTGDISASGFVDEFFVTDGININGANVPKDVIMEQLAIRFGELKEMYNSYAISTYFLGGDTADLPDQVKTIAFDVAVSSRVRETSLLKGNIEQGDVIFGMASDGRALWEVEDNSGLMSNGLTMGRIKLMSTKYNKRYPELIRQEKPFEGRFSIHSMDDRLGAMSVSNAIMSPTRQWAIAIRQIIKQMEYQDALHLLHGIVMNTGGGATKILNIGKNISYSKIMPYPPPIFKLIQEESGEEWKHMYTSFNCGVGIDVIGSPKGGTLEKVLNTVSKWSQIKLFKLGKCFHCPDCKNKVTLKTQFGSFSY